MMDVSADDRAAYRAERLGECADDGTEPCGPPMRTTIGRDVTPVVSAPPRTLFVNHASVMGGAEFILLDVVSGFGAASSALLFQPGPFTEALRSRGLRVSILRNADGFQAIKRDKTLLRAFPLLRRVASAIWQIAGAAKGHDLIYANSQKAFVLSAPASLIARRPLVWHLHDIISSAHFGAMQRRLIVSLANRFASKVIVPSDAAASAFTDAGGKASLVHVVANGLDVAPATESAHDIRRSLGLPSGFLFGVFSRLAPWKGQHVALEALAKVPDARCIIAGSALFGEDGYALALRHLAVKLGVAERVIFLGQRDDIPRLMRAMDAVVHPSVQAEPFGRTLVEAMLCGVPVVATSGGAAGLILDGGRAGFLVPPADAGALSSILRTIAADGAQAAALVSRARVRASTLFSASRMISEILDVVTPLARRRS